MNTEKFEKSMVAIRERLEKEDQVRDQVLRENRQIIRKCSEAIKAIHRQEYDKADEKIKNASSMLNEMKEMVKDIPSLECWGGILSAAQELGEAIVISTIIRDDVIPSPEECGINSTTYMLSLCDVIGELRRYLMNSLRNRDLENAQRAFDYMEAIYTELMTIDYTKMLVGPLRSKVDNGRRLVNRSRDDLVNSLQAKELEEAMSNLSKQLDELKSKD
jgi:translin